MRNFLNKGEMRPKILVVGSFVMDQIVTTDRIPEQGHTIFAKQFAKAPGGKGANQAVQMARLGARVTMCGKLGRDANGAELLVECTNAGIDTEHVTYTDRTASGCAVIILEEQDGGSTQNRIMVIPGSNMELTLEDVAFLEDTIQQYDMVVLQLEIPLKVNIQVAQYARARNVPVMLNPAPSAPLPEELLKCLTYISPNEHEIRDLTGVCHGGGTDLIRLREAAQVLLERGVGHVLITLGSQGAALIGREGAILSPAVRGTQAVDPTAAGDSFIGAFCFCIAQGIPPEEALRFANHTAALTVSRMGAMPSLPILDQVLQTVPDSLISFFRR